MPLRQRNRRAVIPVGERPLTPFKLGLLSVIYLRERQTWTIGCHPSHRTRALRELRESGHVTYAWTRDAWSLTRKGEAAVEADRNYDGEAV